MNEVVLVEPRDDHVFFVKQSNGKAGGFDVSRYLDKGIFTELHDVSYFNQARPALGGVIWPHEQDFGADTIEMDMSVLETQGV